MPSDRNVKNEPSRPKPVEEPAQKDDPKRPSRRNDAEVSEIISDEEHSDVEMAPEPESKEEEDTAGSPKQHSDDDSSERTATSGSSRRRDQRAQDDAASGGSSSRRSDIDGENKSEDEEASDDEKSSSRSSSRSPDRQKKRSGAKRKSSKSRRQKSPSTRSNSRHSRSESDSDRTRSGRSETDEAASDGDKSPKRKQRKSNESRGEPVDVQEKPEAPSSPEQPVVVQEQPVPIKPIIYYAALQGCRSVEEFECLNKIEEGAYGVVFRAKDKKSNQVVALKRLKMEKEREGFPITSLREVDTLLKAQHQNVVTVREIVVGSNMDKIYMVMDYVEHDLKSLMQYSMKKPFQTSEVKNLMIQLLRGIAHLHDNWIIHRDLKTSNLLLSHKGILKIADFGLAREYGSPLKEYTPIVVTLWYRSPELLLGVKKYSTSVDIWSVGCIFGELMLMKALFPGKNEKDQLDKIFKDLGTPNDKIWAEFKDLPLTKRLTFPNFPYNTLRGRFGAYLSDKGFELINKFLTYDPERRITAESALKHEYFQESPLPIESSMLQTWPAKSEGLGKKLTQDSEPRAPSAGKMYEKLLTEEEGFQLQMPIATGFTLR